MGEKLIDQVTDATGFTNDFLGNELKTHLTSLVRNSGYAVDDLSLEDLRAILADYLQDVLLHAKDAHAAE